MSEYSECLLNLPPHQRACASCEKLRECAHGMKVVQSDTSINRKGDQIQRGLDALSEDASLAELRSGPCLLGYPPIMRSCATCPKLYECLHGQKVVHEDSITKKVLELDWVVTSVSELKKMSLEQLIEYNTARDTYEKQGLGRKRKQSLTAGAYDRETKRWVRNVLTGESETAQDAGGAGEGLTVGYYDREKKRWVAKK